MKPKNKLPLARVMWQYTADMGTTCLNDAPLKDGGTEQCVLVLPMPSLKSARQRAKWENLSEGEKVERLAEAMNKELGYLSGHTLKFKMDEARVLAAACLAVMEGRT